MVRNFWLELLNDTIDDCDLNRFRLLPGLNDDSPPAVVLFEGDESRSACACAEVAIGCESGMSQVRNCIDIDIDIEDDDDELVISILVVYQLHT